MYIADSLSDDDLAEALRPARLRGLSEYVLDIPHADLLANAKSARAKAKSGEGYRHPGPLDVARTVRAEGEAPTLVNARVDLSHAALGAAFATPFAGELDRDRSLEAVSLFAPSRERAVGHEFEERRGNVFFGLADSDTSDFDFPAFPRDILGTDTRYFVTHSDVTTWPRTSTIAMGASVTAGGDLTDAVCSGQMIGYYTAVTAAHCIWDSAHPSPFPEWPIATGVVTSLNQWGGRVQTRHSPATVCYDRYYPSQWPTEFSWDFDYGVIEFGGCESFPGLNGNWIGAGWNSDTVYRTEPLYLEAYDNILADGNPSNDFGTYRDPSLRGRYDGATNAVYMVGPPNYRFLGTTRLDATGGASGGCVRQQLWKGIVPYDWHCSGVVSHGDATSTLFRRMEPEFYAFIQSYSEF